MEITLLRKIRKLSRMCVQSGVLKKYRSYGDIIREKKIYFKKNLCCDVIHIIFLTYWLLLPAYRQMMMMMMKILFSSQKKVFHKFHNLFIIFERIWHMYIIIIETLSQANFSFKLEISREIFFYLLTHLEFILFLLSRFTVKFFFQNFFL
jgi:hypothetical protein